MKRGKVRTSRFPPVSPGPVYAERQLARVRRRIAAQREEQFAAQGLSEIEVYEQLAASKAHRQLQRDEAFYQQMWLRIQRHLERLPVGVTSSEPVKLQPFRQSPGEPRAVGSPDPLGQTPRAA